MQYVQAFVANPESFMETASALPDDTPNKAEIVKYMQQLTQIAVEARESNDSSKLDQLLKEPAVVSLIANVGKVVGTESMQNGGSVAEDRERLAKAAYLKALAKRQGGHEELYVPTPDGYQDTQTIAVRTPDGSIYAGESGNMERKHGADSALISRVLVEKLKKK